MSKTAPLQHAPVRCALCGADDARVVRVLHHRPGQMLYRDGAAVPMAGSETLVQCHRCGLVYLNPQPRPATPWRTYSAAQEASYFEATAAVREQGAERLLLLLEQRLGRTGHLLDIGCGDGALLRIAQRQGWRVAGVERSPRLALAAQTGPLAGRVIEGRAEDLGPGLGPYDAVTMLNVLEHVSDPGLVLANASRVLRPGGLLALHVPNYGWGRLWGGRWHQLEPLDHLTYFTPQTLAEMLTMHGLAPVGRFSLPQGNSFAHAMQRLLNRLGIWPGSGLGMLAVRCEL